MAQAYRSDAQGLYCVLSRHAEQAGKGLIWHDVDEQGAASSQVHKATSTELKSSTDHYNQVQTDPGSLECKCMVRKGKARASDAATQVNSGSEEKPHHGGHIKHEGTQGVQGRHQVCNCGSRARPAGTTSFETIMVKFNNL
jgi:hypothetical protein